MKEYDCIRRFIFEDMGIRGEWVCLRDSLGQAKQFQKLAGQSVEELLGQALAAVVLLSATIKFRGSMVLQVQGDGDVQAIVTQASSDRKIRGLVRSAERVSGTTLKDMLGDGRLVLTCESDIGEPYQGVVPVESGSLAEVLQTYFRQSEQLTTRIWLFANENQAAGLMLQELPGDKNAQSDWERIEMLADTLTEQEMMTLDSEVLLYRLFNQERVRLFDAEPVSFECPCSRRKISAVLRTLGRVELEDIIRERGSIDVDCQFCGKKYRFDQIDVEHLLLDQLTDQTPPATRH